MFFCLISHSLHINVNIRSVFEAYLYRILLMVWSRVEGQHDPAMLDKQNKTALPT